MTIIQGGYVRRIKEGTHIKACIKAIFVLIPSFVLIALATNQLTFYLGLLLYCYSSAVVVQSFTAFISNYGNEDEKGTITGICRSIGALARAFGPTFSSMSNLIHIFFFHIYFTIRSKFWHFHFKCNYYI